MFRLKGEFWTNKNEMIEDIELDKLLERIKNNDFKELIEEKGNNIIACKINSSK